MLASASSEAVAASSQAASDVSRLSVEAFDRELIPSEDSYNVMRLSRRLVGGASLGNLKKMCSAVRLSALGTEAQLESRLEHFLRDANFAENDFQPSHHDATVIAETDFDLKFLHAQPLTVETIVDLLESIARK
jgi:hypothetical protein